ncbi:ABC transporter permease [Natronolimnohabitans innermongolicus]|uniref:ABC-type transport system permease protein n=1 Tax=Natronolimnohabitans innermongolicus JCM 12255 TaxID=1227499 RepID=L9WSY4_9EURY|nr:ABC transporter permease [Natronolimnohabitans innermongolicus]ELY52527.1 ABC-type transport system permease protein [Natronolimnohabitans innermongolicus JCM 12255]
MDLLALLRKEAIGSRRNLGLLVVLLLVLPGGIVAGTAVFEQTVPQDVPVGVVADEEASEGDVAITTMAMEQFATPVEYDSDEEARDDLQREEIYLVVHVPGGIMDEETDANVTVVSDHAFAPLEEPINESLGIAESELDGAVASNASIDHDQVGDERSLSEFLVPTGVFVFVTLYALVYLPYQLRSERLVLDRLQTESRLETVVASKLLFYGAALVVSLSAVAAVGWWLGYNVATLSPLTLGVVGVTFLYLAAIGLAVTFALGLRQTALFVNLGLALAIFGLSSLVYPTGFFSSRQGTISELLPTYYSSVTTRSAMLRDAPASLYADYLLWLAATAFGSLVLLQLSLIWYRRRR